MVAWGTIQRSHDEISTGKMYLTIKQFDISHSRLVCWQMKFHSKKKKRRSNLSGWEWNISTCPWSSCSVVCSCQLSPSCWRSSFAFFRGMIVIDCKLFDLHTVLLYCTTLFNVQFYFHCTLNLSMNVNIVKLNWIIKKRLSQAEFLLKEKEKFW